MWRRAIEIRAAQMRRAKTVSETLGGQMSGPLEQACKETFREVCDLSSLQIADSQKDMLF